MARFNCFSSLLVGKKKKSKESPKSVSAKHVSGHGGNPTVKPEELINQSYGKEEKEAALDILMPFKTDERSSPLSVKPVHDEKWSRAETPAEAAYEGGDEHDDMVSMKRDYSDLDLQALEAGKGELKPHDLNNYELENKSEREEEGITPELAMQSGHASDPGMGRTTAFWGSPRLKRSCSNIETKRNIRLPTSPLKSQSYNNLQNLAGNANGDLLNGMPSSPLSAMTNCSADRVMLKKRSSSQVLPSRSRKLWWKLFLWSHRNLHRPWNSKPQRLLSTKHAGNKKGGYSSDTLEPNCAPDKKNKRPMEERGNNNRADMWPQNQWVAFSAGSSPLDRVNAWVNSLESSPLCPVDDDEIDEGETSGSVPLLNSSEIGESSGKNHSYTGKRFIEEFVQANNIIQSLNPVSSVAHISGMGLKVIPAISAFSSLRAVNLSGNFIVHITPGMLPKSLHTLDLSRNKIATIEGLRELTRLRVLNLSYNRISRIGHGLSNCTLIKELYLTGNKISDVEGLHRLLKLSVLDLSFNKITTAKSLGQLVANYSSLLALNLLGNPIQTNIGDDQLRKAVSGLLPNLTYLNKQSIKPQRVREVATDSVARAALGNSGWNSRRRSARRASQGSASLIRGASSSVSGQKGSKHRSKSRHGSSSRK
ncbi:putative leucine-rich repeat domain superfamily [Dioscorea sansibarensis]